MRSLVAGVLAALPFVGLGSLQIWHGTGDQRGSMSSAVRVTDREAEALSQLHAAHLEEISAGALAVEHGQSREVRAYGQHLIDEHMLADLELKGLAKSKQVALADRARDALRTLRATRDADFDDVFVATMIKEHDAAIEVVRQALRDSKDGDLVELLKGTLPHLKKLRDIAERIFDRSKG